jgi:hypothetical protein
MLEILMNNFLRHSVKKTRKINTFGTCVFQQSPKEQDQAPSRKKGKDELSTEK